MSEDHMTTISFTNANVKRYVVVDDDAPLHASTKTIPDGCLAEERAYFCNPLESHPTMLAIPVHG